MDFARPYSEATEEGVHAVLSYSEKIPIIPYTQFVSLALSCEITNVPCLPVSFSMCHPIPVDIASCEKF